MGKVGGGRWEVGHRVAKPWQDRIEISMSIPSNGSGQVSGFDHSTIIKGTLLLSCLHPKP